MAADIEIRSLDDSGVPPQQHNQSKQKRTSTKQSKSDHIAVSYNDIVILKDGRCGKIKFIGTLGYKSETWCGLILSTPSGTHNGIVNTRKYWVCKHNHGTFVKRSQIQKIKLERLGPRFAIHEKVKTPKGKAYIRFIGAIYDKHCIAEEEWYHEHVRKDKRVDNVMYGVELCNQIGGNSGSIHSEYYFTCPHYRGMFYKEKELIQMTKDAPTTPKTHKKKIDDEISSALFAETEPLEQMDDESLSDSSSDDEFLSDDDIKRISLSANGTMDDRLSFARILCGFKHVQNANHRVRSIANHYDSMTQKTRYSIEFKPLSTKTEAQLAHDIINSAKRQRAGTLPHNVGSASSVYHPPLFVDSMDACNKAEQPFVLTKSLSNPCSPRHNTLKDRTNHEYPVSKPGLQSSQSNTSLKNFERVTPKGKKGKRRKIQFDDTETTEKILSLTLDNLDDDPLSPTPPIVLSPKESLNTAGHTIEEEVNIEQESPLHTSMNASRDSLDNLQNDEDVMSLPFNQYQGRSVKHKVTQHHAPMTLTGITCDHDSSVTSDSTNSSHGYISPGIISPGGGMLNLILQDSASVDLDIDEESVAVVAEARAQAEYLDIVSNSTSQNTNDRTLKAFKLKAKPDSPFDVSSTVRDFEKVAEILMLECNNPKNLFKVLKGVVSKLRVSDAKYRRIDMMNSAVQNKLLRFEGAEEFLMLLGFKQSAHNATIWYCEANQPPLSVLDAATDVCNDCLLKCNYKRTTVDMLKRFGKHELNSHKKKRKKRNGRKRRKRVSRNKLHKVKSMDSLSENVVVKDKGMNAVISRTRHGSIHVDGTMSGGEREDTEEKEKEKDMEKEKEKEKRKERHVPPMGNLSVSIDSDIRTPSVRIGDTTDVLSKYDNLKFELQLEGGDEDRFQLSDIVWSVTHRDNTDTAARAIILLCFATFSDEYKLINCLIERFFEPESTGRDLSSRQTESSVSVSDSDTGTHSPKSSTITASSKYDFAANVSRIESLWEVQVKVISFIQQWMRTYWAEDWDQNDKLLEIIEEFCVKIEYCYKNDSCLSSKEVKGGLKLVKMIHQTMDVQENTYRLIQKRATISGRGRGPMPHSSKFDGLAGVGVIVNKLRYGFVKIDNKRLAQQITLLDFKYFRAIKKRECLGQSWKKSDKLTLAPNICALIDQFNKMSKWVQATILLAKNVKTRGRLIKKFIKIGNQLLALRNFQSFCAFHLALSSAVIHKLAQAWTYVPAKHRARFEEMRVIFNTRNNMGNLRKLHREAHPPLIPYTGIFLSDLVGIEEGNKKYKDDGTVNFANLMRLTNAIDNILLYQRTQYEIQSDIAVQSLLLEDFKINAKLDAEYIYRFSVDVARKDLPLKKKSMLSIFMNTHSK